jgi:hypothetical protein
MEKMERERKRRGAAENKKTTPFSFLTAIFFYFSNHLLCVLLLCYERESFTHAKAPLLCTATHICTKEMRRKTPVSETHLPAVYCFSIFSCCCCCFNVSEKHIGKLTYYKTSKRRERNYQEGKHTKETKL